MLPKPLEKQLDQVAAPARPRKGRAFLMVSTGEGAGTVFPVMNARVTVGRSLDAEICIEEQAISNEHAELAETPAGFTLRDLGSTNGTYVNGQRLVAPVVLAGGDTICMGSTTFTFVTRESGLPKGTVRLQNPNPELPLEPERRRAPAGGALAALPDSEQRYTGSVSLTDVVRTVKLCWVYLRRYGRMAGAALCTGVLLGAAQAWLRPPPGSAWFEMTLVSTGRGEDDAGPPVFVGPESTFKSLPLIKRTLTRLGVRDVSDVVASDVQSLLSFEPVRFDSSVWRGEYEAATAQQAAEFLSAHVTVYVESELDKLLKVLRTDVEFDREQAERGRQHVAEARAKLIEFSDEHPEAVPKGAELPEEARTRVGPGASAERIQQSILGAQRALRAAYTSMQSKKAQPYLDQAVAAESKIAEARARGLRDQHPEIRSLSNLQAAMRAKANALLAAEPSPSEQSLDPRVVRLKEELAELTARLTRLQAPSEGPAGESHQVLTSSKPGPSLPAAPSVSVVSEPEPERSLSQLKIIYAELAREYERAKTEHDALLAKLDTTERQLERERMSAEAHYDIITPPTAASASVLSAAVRRGTLGGIAGLLVACVVAACLELRRILIARGHL